MDDKGIITALNSSEVQRQTPEFLEKNSAAAVPAAPDLFARDDVPAEMPSTSSKEEAFFDEGAGLETKRSAGRPKGSKNKSTKEWVEFFLSHHKSPLMFLGSIISEKTSDLARRTCSDRLDALKVQIAAANALLPYIHQKQPLAVEVKSEELPTINIYTSPTVYNNITHNNQLNKQVIVDGIASTNAEELSLKNNNLIDYANAESENKV